MADFDNNNEKFFSGVGDDAGNDMNDENCFSNENVAEGELPSDNVADDEVEVLQRDLASLKDTHLRLIADFDNYRKRTLKEKAELIKSGGENVFVNLLPIIDDFERALKNIDESTDVEALKQGVDLIYEKFISFLNKNGVKEIKSENAEFNTDLFEAVAIIPAPSPNMKGKIIESIEKGYTLNDKVIRHSKVVVAE